MSSIAAGPNAPLRMDLVYLGFGSNARTSIYTTTLITYHIDDDQTGLHQVIEIESEGEFNYDSETPDFDSLIGGLINRITIRSSDGTVLASMSGLALAVEDFKGFTGPLPDLILQGHDTYSVDHADSVIVENADSGTDTVLASVSYTLASNVEKLHASDPSSTTALNLSGNGLSNEIIGNDGANTLQGLSGNDMLFGGGGDDTLDGGTGSDTMDGGAGDDTYYVDYWDDHVFEKTGSGIDTVLASDSFTLEEESGIENLKAADPSGELGLTFHGNSLDNWIVSDNGSGHLFGEDGNDTLIGGAIGDDLDGGAGDDVLNGGAGSDNMLGADGNDIYYVDDINDGVLEGVGQGTDTILTSVSYALYDDMEAGEIEVLRAADPTGRAALVLTGNGFDNSLYGNAGANTLRGGGGDDALSGGGGNDILDGSEGSDTVLFAGNRQSYSVTRNADGTISVVDYRQDGDGIDTLSGVEYIQFSDIKLDLATVPLNQAPTNISLSNASIRELTAKNTVVGTLSATDPDTGETFTYTLLDDAGGRFTISNGKLVVADALKLDYEQARSYQVKVQVTDKDGATFEKVLTIKVTDLAIEKVSGTSGNDVMTGGKYSDRFSGNAGDDVLSGGLGKDVLNGGSGYDIFVFNTKASKSNVDKIVDFNVKYDTIALENAVFTKLGKPGILNKSFFTIGDKAKDKNDYIIYDKAKGVLYYDADGSGKGKAVEIATLSKKLAMTYKDFFVI